MDRNAKVWGKTSKGTVYHAFNGEGVALCRSNIKGEARMTQTQVDNVVGQNYHVGSKKCMACPGKFNMIVTVAEMDAQLRAEHAASATPVIITADDVAPAQAPADRFSDDVVQALRTLRDGIMNDVARVTLANALDTLDNAGVFASIDEQTGYDLDPAPQITWAVHATRRAWDGDLFLGTATDESAACEAACQKWGRQDSHLSGIRIAPVTGPLDELMDIAGLKTDRCACGHLETMHYRGLGCTAAGFGFRACPCENTHLTVQ